MNDRTVKFRDALGAADSYLHALHMMFEAVELDHDCDACAFELVLSSAQAELNKAQRIVDDMEDDKC
ncbi:MAG: hypothetical protein ACK4P4_09115 [Allorhizobium sp.]